jgi:hypothetical protein
MIETFNRRFMGLEFRFLRFSGTLECRNLNGANKLSGFAGNRLRGL